MKCPHCEFESPPGFAFCGKCGRPLTANPDQISPDVLTGLTRLLPPDLAEALQGAAQAPSPALLERCAATLTSLLRESEAFLPAYQAGQIERSPRPDQAAGQFCAGSLLFADISGFTAIAENLSQAGREGAEETTELVNLFFDAMLAALAEFGGQLISFGGDALLGLFLEPGSAAQAVRAGLRMQADMARFENTVTSRGTFPLRMKAAIHRGRFFWARLGSPRSMLQALFGRDVNRAAEAEGAARAGQVVIDQATKDDIPLALAVEPAGLADFWRVLPAQPGLAAHSAGLAALPHAGLWGVAPSPAGLREGVQRMDALAPYLPGSILSRFSSSFQRVKRAGEHRLAASLFANAGGLDEAVERLGPGREEEITRFLNRYFLGMVDAIHNYEGVINKFDLYPHGVKLLGFFGAPVAHEDDAERAVRAALAMQQAVDEINAEDAGQAGSGQDGRSQLTQKIGLSYGPVFAGFVGADQRHEYTVMGDEVNLAARLMSAAASGEIFASQNVYRKVRRLVDFDARGSLTVKGKSKPVPAFSARGLRSRPEPQHGFQHISAPLIGRAAEMAQLSQAAVRLRSGGGQVITIVGEAGMGKTRLVQEFQQLLPPPAGQPLGQVESPSAAYAWVEGRCLSYLETFSYGLFQPILRQLLGIQADDSRAAAAQRIRARLESCVSPDQLPLSVHYLANFLNLFEDDALNPLRFLEPEAIQRGTFLAIRTVVEHLARSQPLVLVLDDLHWIDPASLKLLESLLPVTTRAPLALVLLYRPERAKGCWKIHDLVRRDYSFLSIELDLQPLAPDDCARMMDALLLSAPLPEAARQMVLKRVDGNPLYLEEILRAFIEPGAGTPAPGGAPAGAGEFEVPDTLQGVLMTRLDHLNETSRIVAQAAAILGRSFSTDLLGSVLPQFDPLAVNQGLVELQQHEILQETQRAPEIVYTFRHALMQDVCYDCLSVRVRRDLHQKAAHSLAGQNDPNAAALIGHHAYSGQDWPMALEYQLLSGRQAQRLFANLEAVGHFQRALESAQNLPAGENERERQEIHLCLGELYTTITQFDDAQKQLDQAYAVAGQRADVDAQVQACRWLARKQELSGNIPSALEWIQRGLALAAGKDSVEAAQLHINAALIFNRQGSEANAQQHSQAAFQIAERLGHLTAMARAHNMLGLITRNHGEHLAAAAHFQKALELYSGAGDTHGQAVTLNLIANTLFNAGQWVESAGYYRKARATFEQLADQYNIAIASNNLGGIALNQENLAEADQCYSEADSLLQKIGASPYVRGIVQMNLGAVRIKQKNAAQAFEHLRRSQEYFDQTQTRDFLPEMNRHLARAALVTRNLARARTHIEESIRLARELSMRTEEGCSLRVLAEIDLAEERYPQAEATLRSSVEILAETGEEYEQAMARAFLSRAILAGDRLQEAGEEAERALGVLERLGIQPG